MDNPEHVTRVEHQGREIIIVGTAHISARSVVEVERVIERERPDAVCVELDQTRYDSILDENRWAKLDVIQVIRERRALYLLASLALSAYQRRLGDRLGVRPGAEFAAAVRKAEEVGARLVLADRDIHVTLKRTWHNLSAWTKARMLVSLLALPFSVEELGEAALEQLKDRDTIGEMLQALANEVPDLKEPLIDERDRYLISTTTDTPGQKIVVVVGAGHVDGMLANLGRPVDREALSVVPPPSWAGKVVAWLVPIVVLAVLGIGYQRNAGHHFAETLLAWAIPNVVTVGLFALLAGAKPLTVTVSAMISPITSLVPTIRKGMVPGLLEARSRRPTAAECQRVTDDVLSIRGVYSNGVTRVLLVALATGLGSTLGAWIGTLWVLHSLF